MKSNGKIKNAATLAKKFGVFVSVDDPKLDLENAKAALRYREEQVEFFKNHPHRKTMQDYVEEYPESAEFFTSKKNKEVCRVTADCNGKTYEWCGLVSDMPRTAPFWIQED